LLAAQSPFYCDLLCFKLNMNGAILLGKTLGLSQNGS